MGFISSLNEFFKNPSKVLGDIGTAIQNNPVEKKYFDDYNFKHGNSAVSSSNGNSGLVINNSSTARSVGNSNIGVNDIPKAVYSIPTSSASDYATQQYDFNHNEAQLTRDWQQYMSSHSHQMEVEDLKAAGLNPILSANSGAVGYSGASASGGSGMDIAKLSAETSKEIARISANSAQKVASINAAANMYGADSSAAASRYNADRNSGANVLGSLLKLI